MIKNKQSMRSFIAFVVTWAFLILTVTGIILYIVPQGRIAYWIDWQLLALDKTEWAQLHMIFGGLFIATGILHLYYNWKPFKKYLSERIAGHIRIKQELITSLLFTLLIIGASILYLPPVSWVFDLNETIKDSWITSPDLEPPFGHAEEVSLAALSRRSELDLQQAQEALRKNNISHNSAQDSLKSIALANNRTPKEIWQLIQHLKKPSETPVDKILTPLDVESQYGGSGLGQKTFSTIAEVTHTDLSLALNRLKAAGIDCVAEDKLKATAENHSLTPIDLLKIILIPDYRPNSGSTGQ
ncbi:MAG: hypothetical protein C0631_02925 [Sedimenticola sp.]|nr:MAG: hypothetical protein C0631_02925 [Sedimenticola sp.]